MNSYEFHGPTYIPNCTHNSPYKDEDPSFFEGLGTEHFGGDYAFRCKHCGYTMYMSLFTEEGTKFMAEFDALNSIMGKNQGQIRDLNQIRDLDQYEEITPLPRYSANPYANPASSFMPRNVQNHGVNDIKVTNYGDRVYSNQDSMMNTKL